MNGLTMRSRKKSKYVWKHEIEHTIAQNLWDTVKSVLRGQFIAVQAYLKDRKISNKQPNSTSTRTRGTTTNKAQSKSKEENNQEEGRIK